MPLSDDFLFSLEVRTFLAFCETANFSGTQSALGLSESTVSRQLTSFEERVGFAVLDKSHRPYTPTGDALYFAKTLMKLYEPVTEVAHDLRSKSSRRAILRLGCYATLATPLAVPFIQSMRGRIRRIKCLTGTSDRLYDRFAAGDLEAMICSMPPVALENVRSDLLFGEPTVLYMPKSAAERYSSWTWERLKYVGLPYIRYPTKSGGKPNNDYFVNHRIELTDVIEADQTAMILELVSSGLGWTATRPSSILSCPSLIDRLAILPMPDPPLYRDIYLISRTTLPIELHRMVVGEMRTIFKEQIIPQIARYAPWAAESMHFGSAPAGSLGT